MPSDENPTSVQPAPLPAAHAAVDAALGREQAREHSRGRATRELLILTAERLFAQRGIHAVSLREIGQVAGQRNNGATQYHFGTREALLRAIYVFRAAPINLRRRELIQQLRAHDQLSDIEALIRAILTPHVDSLRDPENHFVGYLARVLTDEADLAFVADTNLEEHLDGLRELERHLHAQLPSLTRAQFDVRNRTVFAWGIHALAEYQRSHASEKRKEIDAMFDDLVAMLAAAMAAPVRGGRSSRTRGRRSR